MSLHRRGITDIRGITTVAQGEEEVQEGKEEEEMERVDWSWRKSPDM